MEEQDIMAEYLENTPCPLCGGKVTLTGDVGYTAPLAWYCTCSDCGESGTVSYADGIDVIDLPDDKIEEAKAIEDFAEYRKFIRKYGVRRPKSTEIELHMR